jgi:hypothetical protein
LARDFIPARHGRVPLRHNLGIATLALIALSRCLVWPIVGKMRKAFAIAGIAAPRGRA